MSQDRFTNQRESAGPARVRRQPGDRYDKLYLGRQRAPKTADELGATAVIECLFGGRVRLYPDSEGWMRVEYDPAWGLK